MKLFGKSNKGKIKRTFTDSGIEYTYDGEASPSFPLNSNPSDILTQLFKEGALWSALDDLWAAEQLEAVDQNNWRIPYQVYDLLDEWEDERLYDILKLPKPEPLKMSATSSSHVADPNFRIHIEATHPEQGPLREGSPPRFDRVFRLSSEKIVPLIRIQADLFNTAQGNEIDWNDQEDRMRYLASTKNAALKAEASIDSYLANEDYEFRTEAGLDLVEHSPEDLQLIPTIDGMDEFGLTGDQLLEDDQIKGVYNKPESATRRKRMVIDKNLKNNLGRLPKKGRITGTDVPKFITNPESVIPEGYDLSLFSERVKGIRTRVYNSRPYIHVGKNKGGWFEGIPGVELDDWSPADEYGGEQDIASPSNRPHQNLSEETYRQLANQAKETGQEYVFHEGNWIRIDPNTVEQFEKVTQNFEKEDDVYRIPAGSILDIYENLELLEFIDKTTHQKEGQLPDDLPDIEPPAWFQGNLFPYQFDGYRWLHRISNHRIGGLLADDMGLGKTIQVIAHILKLKEAGMGGPHLVIVPKTLIDNWVQETIKFSGNRLSVYPYSGPQRNSNESFLRQFDIVLTTYDTLRFDQSRLATIDWNMVICDEAQNAKNPTTQRTCAVKALKSKHRAALTGTPVENGLIEFWCIMDFVQPGLLGSWADFRTEFERPIVNSEGEERDQTINQLMSKIKGYYLRRQKEDTIELPQKRVETIESYLSDLQLDRYKAIAREAKSGGRGAALGAISKLLRLCGHPNALDGMYFEDKITQCPKLDSTIKILNSIHNANEKAIIFTDFKIIQRILQNRIWEEFDTKPDIINGEVNHNRQKIIDIFAKQKGFNILILGHQVAGVGLNITAANHVIHYTRPWNPAKENQATDRAHRIGQSKPVTVYYPIVTNSDFKTVEERLDELIESKQDLARDVLRPTKDMQVKTEELLNCIDEVA